jgi:hypothetical protein
LWDIENVKIPCEQVTRFVKNLELTFKTVPEIWVIGNHTLISGALRETLFVAGADLLDVPKLHSTRRECSDRTIVRKLIKHSVDPQVAQITVISSDGDFTHDLSSARANGVRVNVITNITPSALIGKGTADGIFTTGDFLADVLPDRLTAITACTRKTSTSV